MVAELFYGRQFETWAINSIPGSGEDGAKNYFTAEYHIKHDSTFIWFEGMNYPEGEHVIFTDNQPLVSNVLKAIGGSAESFPVLVFLSMLIGGWLLFRLFELEGVIWWFALLAALGTVFLSPQLLRLGGHYSLAYVGIIPTFIFLVRKLHFYPSRLNSFFIGALVLATGFIHPYFLIMLVLYWLCISLLILLIKGHEKPLRSWIFHIAFPVLPLILFQLILFLTDTVSDRPSSPYGFVFYSATWASVFLPLDFDYFNSLSQLFNQSAEGGYFIGLFALAGLSLGLVQCFKIKTRIHNWGFSDALLLASLPVLLLSLAFPFYIWKFDYLLEFLGPLRQFRGIGRFAFIFYFAANIYAAIEIGKFVTRAVDYRKFIPALFILLIWVDAYSFHKLVVAKTSVGTSVFHDGFRSEMDRLEIKKEQFQAIIPLPYFHVGSENFRTPETEGIKEQAFALSLKTGLPLHAVQMSRTSLSQTMEHLQLLHYLTEIPDNLTLSPKRNKPFLLLVKTDEAIKNESEKLIAHSSFIQNYRGYELRKLDAIALQHIANENFQEITLRQETAKPLSESNEYFEFFDQQNSERAFAGPGALQVERIEWTDLMPAEQHLSADSTYELSFWFYAGDQQAVNTQLWLWERNGDDEIRFELSEVGDHIEQILGSWILCTVPIKVTSDGNKIEIKAHRDGNNMNIFFDELFLRALGQDYFRPGSMNLNNRYFEPPSE